LKKLHILLVIFLLGSTFLLIINNIKKEKRIWDPLNSLSKVIPPQLKDNVSQDQLIIAINNSLVYLNKKDKYTLVNFGKKSYSIIQIINSLEDFKEKLMKYGLSDIFFDYVKKNYTFYKSNADKVLFTGYYEAGLSGSYKKNKIYKYPIYKKPQDLVRIELKSFPFFKKKNGFPKVLKGRLINNSEIIPFYSRDEIDNQNKLNEKELEILWVDNPVDLFFLQIQGSGIVEMTDGTLVRINYSESNGHPYRAIGRYLVKNNYLELKDISMQSIKKFLEDNPDKTKDVFNYNPSYVFFRKVKDGPIGSIGVPVTPFRSIATDKDIFPRGALCFIKTKIPVFDIDGKITDWKEFTSFVLNQDTGGAIRSPGRVDIFTGHGKSSELIAGHMKQYGELYFIIKELR